MIVFLQGGLRRHVVKQGGISAFIQRRQVHGVKLGGKLVIGTGLQLFIHRFRNRRFYQHFHPTIQHLIAVAFHGLHIFLNLTFGIPGGFKHLADRRQHILAAVEVFHDLLCILPDLLFGQNFTVNLRFLFYTQACHIIFGALRFFRLGQIGGKFIARKNIGVFMRLLVFYHGALQNAVNVGIRQLFGITNRAPHHGRNGIRVGTRNSDDFQIHRLFHNFGQVNIGVFVRPHVTVRPR